MTQYNTRDTAPADTLVRSIDWQTRQANAVVPFAVEDGLPINPVSPGRPAGRGLMRHWGEAVAVDAIVLSSPRPAGRHMLMIERGDGLGWAIPGGGLDAGETPQAAASRELREETGLRVPPGAWTMGRGGYVSDPRATRHAWMVSIPATTIVDGTPPVRAGDDAADAAWLPARTYIELTDAIKARGGTLFAAHSGMIRNALHRHRR